MDHCAAESQLFSMRVDENSALHSQKIDVIKDTGTDKNDHCVGGCLCIDWIEQRFMGLQSITQTTVSLEYTPHVVLLQILISGNPDLALTLRSSQGYAYATFRIELRMPFDFEFEVNGFYAHRLHFSTKRSVLCEPQVQYSPIAQ